MRRLPGWSVLIGLLVVLVALPPIVRNAEWRTLDAAARAGTTGAYMQLGEGLVHYEVAGPETAPPVLLVHGFSVPSYIFDPTFAALVAAGHRVIRFDLYGRGTSACCNGRSLASTCSALPCFPAWRRVNPAISRIQNGFPSGRTAIVNRCAIAASVARFFRPSATSLRATRCPRTKP
ncbi:MAG: hypothetical protein OEW35_20620 [Gammaproteobacteria bacterium]|nr:hypothetical protein [Gammaproteobacteria bacterium]